MLGHAVRGAVFETWVVSVALKSIFSRSAEPDLYFWRDAAGHEVDLLLGQSATQMPTEVKCGQTVASDFFDALIHWRRHARLPAAPAALVYGGSGPYHRGGGPVLTWSDGGRAAAAARGV